MGAARGLQHHPRLWRARARHEPGRRNGAADARGVPERDRSQGQMATRATVERAADVLFCGLLGDLRLSPAFEGRSEEHTSELQSLMRNSYAVFCLKKKKL